jgi:LmbE family N-acetylglucosaminyl deacetylase
VAPSVSLDEYRGQRRNVLIIAPHPDDDVLGAGGTMAAYSETGKGVFSVYVTDGGGSPRKDLNISDAEMALRRQEESMAALKVVGAVGGFFLNYHSADLVEHAEEIKEELVQIVTLLKPEEIYLPAPYERHLTHQHCTRLSVDALRLGALPGTILMGYSLWGGFFGEQKRIVRDITAYIQKKVGAVVSHASQIAYKNYHQGILGKNNYEAIFWKTHEPQKITFVEVFIDMTELLQRKDLTMDDFIREDIEAFIRSFISPSS